MFLKLTKGDTMALYTAQIKYSGRDRLDVTIKSATEVGKLFAPTRNMVFGHKTGKYTDEQYTKMYHDLLANRWNTDKDGFRQITVNMVSMLAGTITQPAGADFTLVCYCAAGKFCHRVLLANWFQNNWPMVVRYMGER
jgi:hypothetical protein